MTKSDDRLTLEIRCTRDSVIEAIEMFLSCLRPPTTQRLSEWVEANRELPSETSANPGPYDVGKCEYQREPMDCVTDHRVRKITLMFGAQTGKSEIKYSAEGFWMAEDPGPALDVEPTQADAENVSKERIAPMIRTTRCLREIVSDARSRDSDNTLLSKKYPGGRLAITAAHSPTGLCARPVRFLVMDEIDRYPASAGSEGDPCDLAEERTTSFPYNKKILQTSTPTIAGASRIAKAYREGSQARFYVPCAACGHMQPLRWRGEGDKKRGCVLWSKSEDGEVDYTTVRYACEACKHDMSDVELADAVRLGRWVHRYPDRWEHRSYHLPSIYAPWVTMVALCRRWHDAQGDTERLKVFVNTRLAETFEETGELIEEAPLYERRESYEALRELPLGVCVITAAVDTQDDRLEIEIKGWGRKRESWSLEYLTLQGDPSIVKGAPGRASLWEQAWDIIESRRYHHPSGAALRIAQTGVDSGGHHTAAVYEWALVHSPRVWAFKGSNNMHAPVWPGRASKGGAKGGLSCPIYVIGVHAAKDVVHASLRQTVVGPSYCHHPDHPYDYFRQLAGEQKIERKRFGNVEWLWIKRPGRRNEAFDLHVYNLAILEGLHVDLDALADRLLIPMTNADALAGEQRHAPSTAVVSRRPAPQRPRTQRDPRAYRRRR